MSLALRWYGSIASRCSSLMLSSFSTPNASSSCLHFVTDATAAFVLQYLLTSLANIEYKWDICKRKKKKKQKRKLIQSLFAIPPLPSVRLHTIQTVIAIDYGNVRSRYKRWKTWGRRRAVDHVDSARQRVMNIAEHETHIGTYLGRKNAIKYVESYDLFLRLRCFLSFNCFFSYFIRF